MFLRPYDDGIEIHRVADPGEAAPYRNGFVAAYRRIFAGPPYEEAFTDEQAGAIFDKLVGAPHQITLIVLREGEVIGFASAIPLSSDPPVARELTGLVPVRHTMYMAELGIDPQFRRRKLAKLLVALRIKAIDRERYTHVVLRLPEGKTESAEMYRSLDFSDMGVSMTVTRRRVDGKVRSDERHFWSRVLSQVRIEEE